MIHLRHHRRNNILSFLNQFNCSKTVVVVNTQLCSHQVINKCGTALNVWLLTKKTDSSVEYQYIYQQYWYCLTALVRVYIFIYCMYVNICPYICIVVNIVWIIVGQGGLLNEPITNKWTHSDDIITWTNDLNTTQIDADQWRSAVSDQVNCWSVVRPTGGCHSSWLTRGINEFWGKELSVQSR